MFILSIVPIPLTRDFGEANAVQRLAEIRGKITTAERRVRDLESLLTQLILTPDEDVIEVTGVTKIVFDPGQKRNRRTADIEQVRDALFRARAYEGELRTAEQFWSQVVQANKEAEKDTHEHFKRA